MEEDSCADWAGYWGGDGERDCGEYCGSINFGATEINSEERAGCPLYGRQMICAMILAAGKSLRMGTQKLLLPFANQTVIGHVADQVIKSAIRQVLVVAAEQSEQIAAALKGKRLSIVINPDFGGDMLSSVRCGLRALPDCEAIMVLLGDQPGIRSELVGEIIRIYETSNVGIIVATYRGKR